MCDLLQHSVTYPVLDGAAEFSQAAFEEMVPSLDQHQFLRWRHRFHQPLECRLRPILVPRSAYEELRQRALFKKGVVIVAVVNWRHRGTERDQRDHIGIRASGAPNENPAKIMGRLNSRFNHSSATRTSSASPRP